MADKCLMERKTKMEKLAKYGEDLIREFGLRKDVLVTYDRPDKETIKKYTEFQQKYFGIVYGCEYFLFLERDTNDLIYVVNVTYDSYLTAVEEMITLAAKKF